MIDPRELEGFEKDVFFLGVSLLLAVSFVAANNVTVSEDQPEVGPIELQTECIGFDAGVCLGIEHVTHTVDNYFDDNYTDPEPGTEVYYQRVEAELMLQGYGVCRENQDMTGMDWVDETSYDNKTGDEWLENENIQLLRCEDTFRYTLED